MPGDDRELADQVEPRGPPAPVLVLHLRRPVIEAAGRRVGRRDLAHRGGDQQDEDRDERPADEHGRGAGPGEPVVVEDDRAGQDRDDREADREVAESAHRAVTAPARSPACVGPRGPSAEPLRGYEPVSSRPPSIDLLDGVPPRRAAGSSLRPGRNGDPARGGAGRMTLGSSQSRPLSRPGAGCRANRSVRGHRLGDRRLALLSKRQVRR